MRMNCVKNRNVKKIRITKEWFIPEPYNKACFESLK